MPEQQEKKRKPGRPRREFTTEEIAKIEQMALDNCHLDTIAMALSIPKQTLVDNYRTFIEQKRAFGRTGLRRIQHKQAVTNPVMAIFLGKNELDQSDKKEVAHSGEVSVNLIKYGDKNPSEAQEIRENTING